MADALYFLKCKDIRLALLAMVVMQRIDVRYFSATIHIPEALVPQGLCITFAAGKESATRRRLHGCRPPDTLHKAFARQPPRMQCMSGITSLIRR